MVKLVHKILGLDRLEARLADLEMKNEKWRKAEEKRIEARIWQVMKDEADEMTTEERRAWEAGLDLEDYAQ